MLENVCISPYYSCSGNKDIPSIVGNRFGKKKALYRFCSLKKVFFFLFLLLLLLFFSVWCEKSSAHLSSLQPPCVTSRRPVTTCQTHHQIHFPHCYRLTVLCSASWQISEDAHPQVWCLDSLSTCPVCLMPLNKIRCSKTPTDLCTNTMTSHSTLLLLYFQHVICCNILSVCIQFKLRFTVFSF